MPNGGQPKPGQSEPNPGAEKPYVLAAEYLGDRAYSQSRRAFKQAEALVVPGDNGMSAYRYFIGADWYVAIVGEPPPQEVEEKLMGVLAEGEPIILPERIVQALNERRLAVQREMQEVERRSRYRLN